MSIQSALLKLGAKLVGGDEKTLGSTSTEGILENIAAKYSAPTNATSAKPGLVKQAANVKEAAGETPTKAEFDALIKAFKDAGIMANS